ncbi:MAG: hypothetical protein KC419_25685 [Anaerolineales bacterium]|nr:hypothetical protein [Anaerolineales bacterium]
MTFNDWMMKKWYIPLACVAIGAELMQFIGDSFFDPNFRFYGTIGLVLGYLVSYVIYKTQYPDQSDTE